MSSSEEFKVPRWAVQTRGRYAGRVGQITEDGGKGSFIIFQAGPSGPVTVIRRDSTRKAQRQEIADKLGCRIADLGQEILDNCPY